MESVDRGGYEGADTEFNLFLSLYTTQCWRMELEATFHALLTLAMHSTEWSTSCCWHFPPPRNRAQHPLNKRLVGHRDKSCLTRTRN